MMSSLSAATTRPAAALTLLRRAPQVSIVHSTPLRRFGCCRHGGGHVIALTTTTISPLASRARFVLFRFSSSFAKKSNDKSLFTSASNRIAATSAASSNPNKPKWRRLARFIKYVRIPFLVVSVYGLGYQQGICDYARNPQDKEQVLMESVLAQVGCTDSSKVDTASAEHGWLANSGQARRVQSVGSQIVRVANLHVEEELQKAVANAKETLPSDLTRDQFNYLLSKNEQVQFWDHALQRIHGDWLYVLVDTNIPNAFVTEILPKRLFITTSMFQFIDNDDELALVLGHEVSHLILGHVSEQNMLQTMMRTIEVLLLSLDPTEGLLSMAIVALLATSRSALTAANSRDNELQADDLGIKLAAMACYDTAKAAKVFYKMHQHSAEGNIAATPNYLSFLDSHPPSVERHEQLLVTSSEENPEKYQDTTCASIRTKLKGLLQPQQQQ